MSKRTLGSLADLARIMEEAAKPDSTLREDRKESKPKAAAAKKKVTATAPKLIDPKRKAWYDKRLREQVTPKVQETALAAPVTLAEPALDPTRTKAVATKATAGLLQVLATANKPKGESKQRAEAWRRKPGDPVF
nr:hypothetical protein [uncultured Holophaga sp.]